MWVYTQVVQQLQMACIGRCGSRQCNTSRHWLGLQSDMHEAPCECRHCNLCGCSKPMLQAMGGRASLVRNAHGETIGRIVIDSGWVVGLQLLQPVYLCCAAEGLGLRVNHLRPRDSEGLSICHPCMLYRGLALHGLSPGSCCMG